jgi:hypothetical protein
MSRNLARNVARNVARKSLTRSPEPPDQGENTGNLTHKRVFSRFVVH